MSFSHEKLCDTETKSNKRSENWIAPPSGLSTIPYTIGIRVDNQVPHHPDWKKCKKNINGKMVKCRTAEMPN